MNINRDIFTGNLTAEPEVNYSPKGTAVVSASIVNNAFYGCADYGVGRISLHNRASLQVSILGIMTAITTTTIVITTKANPTGSNVATGKYEDLVKAGVVDPTKVTRTALQNGASISALMLTTEALVTEMPEKEKPASGGAGGMGGMDY